MSFLDYIGPRLRDRLRQSNEDRREGLRLTTQLKRQDAEDRQYVPIAAPRRPTPAFAPTPEPMSRAEVEAEASRGRTFNDRPMPEDFGATPASAVDLRRRQLMESPEAGRAGLRPYRDPQSPGFFDAAITPLAPESITTPIARGIGAGSRFALEHGVPGVGYAVPALSRATGFNPRIGDFEPLRHGFLPTRAGEEFQQAVTEEGQRIIPAATSPLGLTSAALFPAATAYGTAAAATGGIGGRLLERAGVNPRLRLSLGPFGETNIGPRAGAELVAGAYGGPGRNVRAPAFDTEAAGVVARNTLSDFGQAVPETQARPLLAHESSRPKPLGLDEVRPRISGEGVEIYHPELPPTTQINSELYRAEQVVRDLTDSVKASRGKRGVMALREELNNAKENLGRWQTWKEVDDLRQSDMPVMDQIDELTRRAADAEDTAYRIQALRETGTGKLVQENVRASATSSFLRRRANQYGPEDAGFRASHTPSYTAEVETMAATEFENRGREAVLGGLMREEGLQIVPSRNPSTVTQGGLGGADKPLFQTEGEMQGYRSTQGRMDIGSGERPIETAGPMFAQPESAIPPAGVQSSRELGDVRVRDAGAAPEPVPGAVRGRAPEPAADTGLRDSGAGASDLGPVEGPVSPKGSLASVADDAEAAASKGEPPPPPRVTEPAPIGRKPPYPLPSTLHTVDEIAQDVRRSTQNFAGATARTAGKFPPVRVAIELGNPAALVDTPPAGLVKELGMERAQNLQAQLIAHARKADQGSAIASAIEEGVDQEARRVGFTVKDGVLSAGGRELGPVGDVFENPSRFPLDGPQRQLVDDVHAVLQDMNLAEKAAGVAKGEIFSGEGRYFPRRVVGVRGVENMRAQVRRMTGVKQGFQKGRFYTEMEAGMENGVDYGGAVGSLVATRIRAGVKAVSDTELAQLVRPLGRTIKTGKGGIKVGEMGTMVPAFGGRAFPRETSIRIMEGLNPRPPATVIGAADQVNNLIRPLVANGDLSATTLQLLPTLTRNPVAWAKSVGYSLDALILDGRIYGRYVQANAREIERFISAGGIWNGSEFTFDAAAKGKVLSTLLKRGPLGRTNNAFSTAVNVAALENFKGMVGVGDSMGSAAFRRAGQIAFGNIAGETSDEVAASIASKMTGRMSTKALGVQAQQRAVESALTFAPKYYRAAFGLLGDAMQGGMRGAEARRVLGSLAAGSLLSYVAVAKAMGQDPNLDPTKGNFMTVRVGGAHVGIGGPFYGIARLVASGIDSPEKLGKFDMSNPAYRWLRGRASPIAALVTDLAKQSTYMGKPLDSPKAILEHVATSLLPFTAQSAIEEGPGTIPTQMLGMREFPTSLSEQKNERAAQIVGASDVPEIAAEAGKDYWDMDIGAQALIDADPEAKALQEKIDQGQRERGDAGQLAQDKVKAKQTEIAAAQEIDNDALKAGGDYDTWKENTIRRRAELRGFKEATYGTDFERNTEGQPTRAAVDEYYRIGAESIARNTDELTRRINWDAVKADQVKAWDGLTDRQRQDAQDYLERNLTQTERDEKATQRLYYDSEIPKYKGMTVERAQTVDDFIGDVYAAREAVQAELHWEPGIQLENVAAVLADDRNDPRLLTDWKRLQGKKKNDAISPQWDRFLSENEDALRPFFPDQYGTSYEERMGLTVPNPGMGPQRPAKPPKPARPPTVAERRRDAEEQDAIERELVGAGAGTSYVPIATPRATSSSGGVMERWNRR